MTRRGHGLVKSFGEVKLTQNWGVGWKKPRDCYELLVEPTMNGISVTSTNRKYDLIWFTMRRKPAMIDNHLFSGSTHIKNG